jgi:hypothetical protein
VRFAGQIDSPGNEVACEAAQAVELQRKKPSGAAFKTFEQILSDAQGTFSTKEKVKKTYQYRAVVGETDTCDDAASGTDKVKVKKRRVSPRVPLASASEVGAWPRSP